VIAAENEVRISNWQASRLVRIYYLKKQGLYEADSEAHQWDYKHGLVDQKGKFNKAHAAYEAVRLVKALDAGKKVKPDRPFYELVQKTRATQALAEGQTAKALAVYTSLEKRGVITSREATVVKAQAVAAQLGAAKAHLENNCLYEALETYQGLLAGNLISRDSFNSYVASALPPGMTSKTAFEKLEKVKALKQSIKDDMQLEFTREVKDKLIGDILALKTELFEVIYPAAVIEETQALLMQMVGIGLIGEEDKLSSLMRSQQKFLKEKSLDSISKALENVAAIRKELKALKYPENVTNEVESALVLQLRHFSADLRDEGFLFEAMLVNDNLYALGFRPEAEAGQFMMAPGYFPFWVDSKATEITSLEDKIMERYPDVFGGREKDKLIIVPLNNGENGNSPKFYVYAAPQPRTAFSGSIVLAGDTSLDLHIPGLAKPRKDLSAGFIPPFEDVGLTVADFGQAFAPVKGVVVDLSGEGLDQQNLSYADLRGNYATAFEGQGVVSFLESGKRRHAASGIDFAGQDRRMLGLLARRDQYLRLYAEIGLVKDQQLTAKEQKALNLLVMSSGLTALKGLKGTDALRLIQL